VYQAKTHFDEPLKMQEKQRVHLCYGNNTLWKRHVMEVSRYSWKQKSIN